MIPLHDDNPTEIKPILTVTIIALCVAIFLWQFSRSAQGQEVVIYALGVIPAVLLGNAQLPVDLDWVAPSATIFTSMFLHGGWMHLIGNMLFLWIFGNNIEDAMGHVKFLLFYLLCGVAAVFAQALPDTSSNIPMVGASGAISGVLGAYLLLYPRASVLVLLPLGFIITTVRMKALWVLGIWFGIQFFSSLTAQQGGGGVAFGAHIGGFIAGMALVPFFKKPSHALHNPLTAFK